MRTNTVKININNSYALRALVALIVTSIGMYIYFVNVAILQTAERQDLDESITDIKSSISQLELQLIDGTKEINKEYALALGFREVEDKVYLERDPSTRLSLLNETSSQ